MSTHNEQDDLAKNEQDKLNQNMDWDNGDETYGHSIVESEFKRKNTPDPDHLAKAEQTTSDVNDKLKNENLSSNDDISNRNNLEEKGIGGKDE